MAGSRTSLFQLAISFLSVIVVQFLLLMISTSPLEVSAAQCNQADQKALLAIKAAFNDAYHFASWTPDTPCCDWYDVDCDPSTGRVTGLSIFEDDQLNGTIPSAIGGLVYLQNLLLHKLPKLVGPIPSELSNLENIQLFRIYETKISGSVPAWLSKLTKVSIVDLSSNALGGTIPASLSALKNLAALRLDHNKISGSIPPQINQLAGLDQFNVSYNQLCGEIPAGAVTARFDQYAYIHNKCLCGAPLPACK